MAVTMPGWGYRSACDIFSVIWLHIYSCRNYIPVILFACFINLKKKGLENICEKKDWLVGCIGV